MENKYLLARYLRDNYGWRILVIQSVVRKTRTVLIEIAIVVKLT